MEVLARYGDVLSVVGRGEEGQKSIDEALKLADEVKDESATAEARNALGDSYFYRGDYSSARQQYERARQDARQVGRFPIRVFAPASVSPGWMWSRDERRRLFRR